MKRGDASGALLAIALLLVGALAWTLALRPKPVVDATPLDGLPTRIGAWQSVEIPLEPGVETLLRADKHIQRRYEHPTGELIWLYLGYYGTTRGGRPEHTPWGCYTGAGWAIESHRVLDASPRDGLRVNEMLVQRDGYRRLVHFWYRSHRATGIVGGLDQNLDRLVGRLVHGRADGALVRVSTPLRSPDDQVPARSRLFSFEVQLDPLLAEHWPVETPPDG